MSKKSALIFPLLAMFISDIFLGFHSTIFWVYASFVLISFIGMSLKNKTSFKNVLLATLSSSILFYLITNFGVWAAGGMYPQNLAGLTQSYIMALPFFRNSLLGDLFYSGLFFGGFELVKSLSRDHSLARSHVGK